MRLIIIVNLCKPDLALDFMQNLYFLGFFPKIMAVLPLFTQIQNSL